MITKLLEINMDRDFSNEEYKLILEELYLETECVKFEIDGHYESEFLNQIKEEIRLYINKEPVAYLETKIELMLADWLFVYTTNNKYRFVALEEKYLDMITLIEEGYVDNVNMVKDEASFYYSDLFKLIHNKLFYKGKEVTGMSELLLKIK